MLDDIGGRIRKAIVEDRRHELMYHVGRPGEDGYVNRVLQCWGVDGHNSHTNVCSSSARLGHFLWTGADRPSPDHANAKTILLLSSHLESGHYFNPHAQRIIEGKSHGAKLIVIDPRLSNTSAKADLWLPANPGTEAALLLAIARRLVETRRYNREFVRRWVNWETYLEASRPELPRTFEAFEAALERGVREVHARVRRGRNRRRRRRKIVEAADAIAAAGTAFSTHSWRAAAAGHLWGWQITRCLYLLVVLMGAIGEPGGVNLHATNKFVPKHPNPPPPPDYWNELLFPKEFPLAFFEMSFLLPHFLKEGRGKLDIYFTRVYNPLWTNPDGFTWMEVLQDESKIGLHIALTPIWSETAWFADYVLPMGLGTERHDTMSQETHAGRWLGFRQPVKRVALEKRGRQVDAHARSQSRRGVGGSRVLDRAVLEDRSRRLARHPQVLRVAVPARREDHGRRVLRLDLRELGARPAGGRSEGKPDAAAVHAAATARSRWTTSRTARRTSSRSRPAASRSTASAAPASTRRRASSSSTRRRSRSGAGPSTRSRATCPATSTGATSIAPRTSSTCCRTSGCRR